MKFTITDNTGTINKDSKIEVIIDGVPTRFGLDSYTQNVEGRTAAVFPETSFVVNRDAREIVTTTLTFMETL